MLGAALLALVLTVPGQRVTWTEQPTADAFDALAGEDGIVIALDSPRMAHLLARIETADAEAEACAAVVAARDQQLAAERAVAAARIRAAEERAAIVEPALVKAERRVARAGKRWRFVVGGLAAGLILWASL